MRYVLLLLLLVACGYSVALVLMNSDTANVNLIFSQVNGMSLGLLLIISVCLGVLLGLLAGIQIFRVFQNSWEISRLRKELEVVRTKHIKAVEAAASASKKDVPVEEANEPKLPTV